jgi:hypothetical protein
MRWLADKALMALCGAGFVTAGLGVGFWDRGGAQIFAAGAGLLGVWAVLLAWTARAAGPQPGRRLVPAWVADPRVPRHRRRAMGVAYLAAVGLLVGLAAWWPTAGGPIGFVGLAGMFAVVGVLELVVRPAVLGPAPDSLKS